MFLNRYGLVDPDLLNLVEMDERLQSLKRAAAAGNDPEAQRRYHRELIRAGRTGEVMAHHVRRHADALQAYDAARDANRPLDDVAKNLMQARHNIAQHWRQYGDHPADHVTRGPSETPRQFGTRLINFTLANGTVRGPGPHESVHGSISYDHDEEDRTGHRRSRDAMARAWEREVPEGYAETGDRTYGDGTIKGSYVHFNTGPKPRR
jgi:hypothetical protein